jgi:enediyne biosynthesis protein E4
MFKYTASLLLLLLVACNNDSKTSDASFELLRKENTGLDFKNVLVNSLEFNPLTYMYFFNGGGVATGDFNRDGLADLYFTSNMGACKMFLNMGNMEFRDVTEKAGVSCEKTGGDNSPKWTSGVSLVDINHDGLLDLYVSQVGDYLTVKGKNRLFVCKSIQDGVPMYEDQAEQYGLDFVVFGTQAAFFDYDLDGDLDMFQLNHSVHANGTFGQKKDFIGTQHPLSGDKLMRNDDGKFTEVTLAAGIKSTVIGYGLGIVTGDINLDGWPDIYIGNDFHENDYLYVNQQDGTFRECLNEGIRHTSQFSMGVEMADVNNDGWSELFSLDMLPEDPYILKSSLGEDDYGVYQFKLTYGYSHQYARNTLQKNNGDPAAPGQSPTFSEIGMFAGVHATDWSWASLFLDYDNDGNKDLFISNGIERRMNDIDYANFRTGDENLRFKQGANHLEMKDLSVIEKMPRIKLPNKFFRNTGGFKFQDQEKNIKGALPTFSNGAVYADLDNDGDLDIVVNNLEDEPFVYKNLQADKKNPASNYLSLALKGSPKNPEAVGARAIVFKKNGEKLVYEHSPVRGFQSSALTRLHVGLGDASTVESMVLVWPDRTYQTIPSNPINAIVNVQWSAGLPTFDFDSFQTKPVAPFAFTDVTASTKLAFKHEENQFVEFNREGLIPHMVSAEGPALAVGDANGDGLDDVFFGSSKRRPSKLFMQKNDGTFYENTPRSITLDSLFEDVDALWLDIDRDGDQDLVVAAGGNEYADQQEATKQRMYLNDGKGNFTRKDFEGGYMTAACVLAADMNKDGLVDLFFGARAKPWNYGITPASTLLLNKGNAQFEDVTDKIGGGLKDAGLVKDGVWTDMDNDGDPDLVLALEWEPPTIFVNNNGNFQKQTIGDLSGWWNFMLPYDFDGDGDLDLLAGNLGENNKFHPTKDQPLRLYIADFDENKQVEQIMTYFVKDREVPFANYDELTKQMPYLKKKYLLAKNFAKASLDELFGEGKLKKAVKREVNTLQSMYFENTGKGFQFEPKPLPDVLQYSVLRSALLYDLDGDGKNEVICGGNFYESNIEMGRYDASYGNVLRIGKNGAMEVFPLGNLRLTGQVRRIETVKTGNTSTIVMARNNETAILLKPQK